MFIRNGLLIFALTGLACGEDPKTITTTDGATQEPAKDPVNPNFDNPVVLKPNAEGVVEVAANDKMKYNTNRIEVTGDTVTLQLKHLGVMKKETMGHNLVILKPGTDTTAFITRVNNNKENDSPTGEEVVAKTKMLGGCLLYTSPSPRD